MDLLYVMILITFNICCIFGNILSAYIFSLDPFKANMFKYLMLNSMVDGVLLFTRMLGPFLDSPAFPVWSQSYFLQFYELYIVYYVSRSLDLLSSLISIRISIERLLMVKSDEITPKAREKISKLMTVFVIMPFILFMPGLFYKRIAPIVDDGRLGYNMSNQTFEKQRYYVYYVKDSGFAIFTNYFFHYIVYFMTLSMMAVLNLILICKIKKLGKVKYSFQTNHKLTKGQIRYEKAKSKHTRIFARSQAIKRRSVTMVLWITSIYSGGHFTFAAATSLYLFNKEKFVFTSGLILFCFQFLETLSHGSNILIYFLYNRTFAGHLKQIIRSAFRRK
jgi:hypothetical protein